MVAIPTLFRKLQNVKNLIRPLSKKQLFTKPFKTQHVKKSQTLVKSPSEHFHHVFFIIMGDPDLENMSLSDLLNRRGVS